MKNPNPRIDEYGKILMSHQQRGVNDPGTDRKVNLFIMAHFPQDTADFLLRTEIRRKENILQPM